MISRNHPIKIQQKIQGNHVCVQINIFLPEMDITENRKMEDEYIYSACTNESACQSCAGKVCLLEENLQDQDSYTNYASYNCRLLFTNCWPIVTFRYLQNDEFKELIFFTGCKTFILVHFRKASQDQHHSFCISKIQCLCKGPSPLIN